MSVVELKTYAIGDEVYWAHLENYEYRLECPDCRGKRYLTVILGDDSRIPIECSLCSWGFEGPHGYCKVWQYRTDVQLARIERVELKLKDNEQTAEYGLSGSWCVPADDIFTSKEEAQVRAEARMKELGEAELKQFYAREKNKRTWSFNASYHRGCIKQAQRDLTYHTAKLTIAQQNKKSGLDSVDDANQ